MTIRIIQLIKSETAMYGDIIYTAKGNSHDPIPPLIRRLIAEGIIQANDIVEIRRGGTLCFVPCPAISWAARDTVDDPGDGLVHRPAYIGPHVPIAVPAQVATRTRRGRFRHERRAVQADARSLG